MGERPIYGFDEYADALAAFGKEKLVSILGQKGAMLSELAAAGLPVPKGFTITSPALRAFFSSDPPALPDDLWTEITRHVTLIQESTDRVFAGGEKPFLLAIRNSCEMSMEQNVLSLFQIGLNEETVNAMAPMSENPKFFLTLYLRWIQHYATNYLEFDPEKFSETVTALITEKNVQNETELDVDDMKALCTSLKELLETDGLTFPEDPLEQLKPSIEKVLLSWNSEQAVEFKTSNQVPEDAPIALCIMVHLWTNLSDSCAIGSTLTRNPSNGDPSMVGSYVANVTGADYLAKTKPAQPIATLEGVSQAGFEKLLSLNKEIEKYYKSAAEIDFIIENNDVYFLTSKAVPGNIVSNLKLHVDFVQDGILTKEETVQKLTTEIFQFLTTPFFRDEDLENSADKQIAKGQSVSAGYVVGQVCLSGEKAEDLASQEQDAILILDRYAESENAGLVASRGYISSKDKTSSPAAAIARQQKIAAVFRCKFSIDIDEGTVTFGERTLREGDFLSIDGKAGVVYYGQVPITRINPEENAEIQQILTWADEIRHGQDAPTGGMLLYANADSPEGVQRARSLGAEGIGLYRTDQFLTGDRADLIQRLMLSDDQEERESTLQELEEGLTADFAGVIDTVSGFPCVIRLADPSVQEYLPNLFDLIEEVTIMQIKKQKGADIEPEELQERQKTLERVQTYYEENPAIGLRGVRLSLLIPGLLKAQLRALIEALQGASERGATPQIQLLVPFAICPEEIAKVKAELKTATAAINKEHEGPVSVEFGAGIEVPRAGFVAEKIAAESEFLVFGTNELTELVFGYSREDAEKEFLAQYQELEVIPRSPFEVLDQEGVGELIGLAIVAARTANPSIPIGVAGDNCGDPQTVRFLHALGVNFVSCSANALPLARLAAAQVTFEAE